MISIRRFSFLALVSFLSFPVFAASPHHSFIMAITTSIQDSGLLAPLAAAFERDSGITANAISVGSGRALRMASDGAVQLTLTHDPENEKAFVKSGKAKLYRQFMKSDFAIVGPKNDPAGVRNARTAAEAFQKIAAARNRFVSRDDQSGTNSRELKLWAAAGVDPGRNPNYQRLRQGMSGALRSSSELRAYTLSDLATFSELERSLDLAVLFRGGAALENVYSLIVVKRTHPTDEDRNAERFARWLLSPQARKVIESFRIGGQQQFFWVAK